MKFSRYLIVNKIDNDFSLLYSTKSGEYIRIRNSIYDRISNGIYSNNETEIINILFEKSFLVDSNKDEFFEVMKNFKNKSNDNEGNLSLTIQPTANCQLGCSYCGQNHQNINVDILKARIIIKYVKSILNKSSYKLLNIVWYGAEPILGIKAIRTFSDEIIHFCKENNIKYTASIITNGVSLNEKVFEDLAKREVINYQITLDGTKEIHDNSRFLKKGKGRTYDRIIKNITSVTENKLYEDKKCNILIRYNVHKENLADVDNLIKELVDRGLNSKVSMNFAPIHDWGGNDAENNIGISPELFAEYEMDWMMLLDENKFRTIDRYLPNPKRTTCMLTDSKSELIDAKLRISNCWETPYTEEFDYDNSPFFIGSILSNNKKVRNQMPIGNWYDNIEQNTHTNWCKNCIFLPSCGGGCPTSWLKGKPACPSFKYNIKDRMIMQYIKDNINN